LNGTKELSVEDVVLEVLARNPTLAQMVAATEAANARYPQVTALDDPMVATTYGPATIGSNRADFAYVIDVSQRYPWPGKLPLRGQNAQAEARAAGWEVADTRLQLILSARDAYYSYYLVHRALEVNEEGLRLLQEFRQNAETRYQTGLVPQQDVLQADVEIGRQRERLIALERLRQVVIARMNTLMHMAPDDSLPPPPQRLPMPNALPGADELRAAALSQRPDLLAQVERIRAEQALLGLAYKEYYPDFEAFASWNKFMGNENEQLAPMVGARLNLPVRRARRDATVNEAQARVAQQQAALERLIDQANFEVQQAYAQVRESAQALQLYERTILPAARENVRSAQSTYITGRIPFLTLIEAERSFVTLSDRFYETVAEYLSRWAALERAVGGPLAAPAPAPAPAGTPR
jgi:outer membrane protein TolC